MVAVGPHSWNATALDVQNDAVTLDVRSKWVNYHDGGGLWLPIESTWSEGSNGEYEHTASNWTLIAPATASGRIATYNENDWDIASGGTITLTRTPALELEHVNASGLVDASYDPARPYEVRYPNAFGTGCSLVLRTWHARAMRPEHIIEITQLPANGADVEIVERVYTTLRIPGWDGSDVDIGATGAGLYVPSDTVGMGMRPAVAWWRGPDGVLQTRSIGVIAKRETGYVTLRKIIPYDFIAEGLAAGAVAVYADETLTVNPDPNVEATSVDGYTGRSSAQAAFATLIAGAGTQSSDSATSQVAIGLTAGATSNLYTLIRRGFFLFDTSALGSGATVTAATLSISGYLTTVQMTPAELAVVSANPLSNTAITSSDHLRFETTELASRVNYTSWNAAGYVDVPLNASGVAAVATTGISKFCTRLGCDVDATAPAWSSSSVTHYGMLFAEQAGTSSDPKLVVTYTAGGGGGSSTVDGRSFPRGVGRGIMRGCA